MAHEFGNSGVPESNDPDRTVPDSAHVENVLTSSPALPQGRSIAALGTFFFVFGVVTFQWLTVFSIPLVLGGLVMALFGLWHVAKSFLATVKWGAMTLHYSEWEIGPGSEVTISFTRTKKRSIADQPNISLPIFLTCTEEVRWEESSSNEHGGTRTRTKSQEVSRTQYEISGHIQNNTFTASTTIHIPVNEGGPTLALKHHSINWALEMNGKPISMDRNFAVPVRVAPVLDRRFVDFVDAPPPPKAP